MKKIILFYALLYSFCIAIAQSQTTTTANQSNRYFMLVKYNVELKSIQHTFHQNQIKTNGEVREGDKDEKGWMDWTVVFRTQGEIKGTNFEATVEPETGIIDFGRTENSKILTRDNNGITGKTFGSYNHIETTKNIYTNYITTKHDIATNEGFNKDIECRSILSTNGDGDGIIKLAPTESYDIQMRFNPKNKRVEIRNWLPQAELTMQGLQGGSSSGDESCNKNNIPSTDVSEFITQYTLGLNELIQNAILYNSKEGVDENGREIPYKDITNLGEFMAYRLTNQSLNEVQVAETGNRYVYNITLADSYMDPVRNINNNNGNFKTVDAEIKEFKIRASITIAFQRKEPTFNEYPGGDLPPEVPEEYPNYWIPLMDKDDYATKESTPNKNKQRNITLHLKTYDGNPVFSDIKIPTGYVQTLVNDYSVKTDRINKGTLHVRPNGTNPFSANVYAPKISICIELDTLVKKITIPAYGNDTTIDVITGYKSYFVTGDFQKYNIDSMPEIPIMMEQTIVSDDNYLNGSSDLTYITYDGIHKYYYAPTRNGILVLKPQVPANMKVYPSSQTVNVNGHTLGENLTSFIVYKKTENIYKVKCVVTDRNGNKLNEVPIDLENNNNQILINQTVSDKNGEYTFYLPAGTYTFSVMGGQPQQQTVTVTNADVSVSFVKN